MAENPLMTFLRARIQAMEVDDQTTADDISAAIGEELAMHPHDKVGDMSIDEFYGLVEEASAKSRGAHASSVMPDRGTVVGAVFEDLVEKTAAALADVYPQKNAKEIQVLIQANLASGSPGEVETQHIYASIASMIQAAQAGDPSLPALSTADEQAVVTTIVSDVETALATTIVNEMVPPAAQLDGGYQTSGGKYSTSTGDNPMKVSDPSGAPSQPTTLPDSPSSPSAPGGTSAPGGPSGPGGTS